MKHRKLIQFLESVWPTVVITVFFFVVYIILSIVRHNHYGSFGADLGFIDHLMWLMSTLQFSQFLPVFSGHFEPIYFLMMPFYWLWSDPRMLLILQAAVIASAGIPLFLLAREKKINLAICYVLLFSLLTFYGVQNAIWFDFHTTPFGAAFFIWFLYFLELKNIKFSLAFFILTIISKENFAPYVFLLTGIHFVMTRNRHALYYCILAFVYSFILFFIYFPAVRETGYVYSNSTGLVSGSPLQLIDTTKKQTTLFYTFASVGFLPFLTPLYIFPIIGNLATYFVLGREYEAAHEIFMHYRIDLTPLLFFATIMTITKFKFLNTKYIAAYLLICALSVQYALHLPLSYLSKSWFWTRPSGVNAINKLKEELPENVSLAAQNNIYPHVSQRDEISLLWPDTRFFKDNSPCDKSLCPWFRWEGSPEYMIVDLSPEWDIRHLLHQNSEYKQAVESMEKYGVIKKYKQEQTAIIYKVMTKAK